MLTACMIRELFPDPCVAYPKGKGEYCILGSVYLLLNPVQENYLVGRFPRDFLGADILCWANIRLHTPDVLTDILWIGSKPTYALNFARLIILYNDDGKTNEAYDVLQQALDFDGSPEALEKYKAIETKLKEIADALGLST